MSNWKKIEKLELTRIIISLIFKQNLVTIGYHSWLHFFSSKIVENNIPDFKKHQTYIFIKIESLAEFDLNKEWCPAFDWHTEHVHVNYLQKLAI